MKPLNVLVIKHGAFGDMITASGAFSAIRRHHQQDNITLLTSARFEKMAQGMGFFNNIIADERSNNPFKLWTLRNKLRDEHFGCVYDLQNSSRTALYYWLLGPWHQPRWSGIVYGCSHRQARKDRELLPASCRFADQLRIAGLPLPEDCELLPEVSWLEADTKHFGLPASYALLVPGSSTSGLIKRWPVQNYIACARWLLSQKIMPVLIAGPEEKSLVAEIRETVPQIRDLSEQASFAEIASLGRKAVAVIGNDTGPTHLIAATGCPTVIPWSGFSEPEIYAPRGPHVITVYEENLENLAVERVLEACKICLSNSAKSEYNT